MLFIPGIISTLKPGRQLAEYMRDEMPQEQTVYKNFEFTPNLQQNLSSSGLSGEYSYIVEFIALPYLLTKLLKQILASWIFFKQ